MKIEHIPFSGIGADRCAPRVAVLCNSFTPYRVHLHTRIERELSEVELWSLATHGNSLNRWQGLAVPSSIRPVDFGSGEPTSDQTLQRYALREWRKAGRIINWLKEKRIKALFCQGYGDVGRLRVMRWCHRHQVPCFLTGDSNIRDENFRGFKRAAKDFVVRRALSWCHGAMPCGQLGRDFLERCGANPDTIYHWPYCPDVRLFQDPPPQLVAEMAKRYALRPGRRRIVFSGRMLPRKRPDLAIDAFAAISRERPEWDLLMIGEGPLRRSLIERLPAPLRAQCIWTGFIHEMEKLAAIYASCDVLLLPSALEPWGVVVIEAAASGLAIVASDVVGAAAELVDPTCNGAVFPSGNLTALQAALRTVTDPQRIDGFKRGSPAILENWLSETDPVQGFRHALVACGVLPKESPRRTPAKRPRATRAR